MRRRRKAACACASPPRPISRPLNSGWRPASTISPSWIPTNTRSFTSAPATRCLPGKDRPLEGIVVVRRDAPYRELADLKGQTLVFPAPAAFAATLLVRADLTRRGITITPRFVISHDSVYLNVARASIRLAVASSAPSSVSHRRFTINCAFFDHPTRHAECHRRPSTGSRRGGGTTTASDAESG